MITIGTAVFQRITAECRSMGFAQGLETATNAGKKALADTMAETNRFGSFSKEYLERCAADRLNYYMRHSNATCTNQLYPAA